MECARCHSPRIIKFLDGFGQRRVFCRSCHESFPLKHIIQDEATQQIMKEQKKLLDFTGYYEVIKI